MISISNKSIGRGIIEEKEQPSTSYRKLYNNLLKDLAFTYGVPPGLAKNVFKFASKQNMVNSIRTIDTEFKKKVVQSNRDKGTLKCAECGTTENLTFHHLKHKAEYPELIYDIDNIQLLCKNCHDKVHNQTRKEKKDDDTMAESKLLRMKMLGLKEDDNEDSIITLTVNHKISFETSDYDKIIVGDKVQETLLEPLKDLCVGDIIKADFKDEDTVLYLICSAIDFKLFNELDSYDAMAEGYPTLEEYKNNLISKYDVNDDSKLGLYLFTCINN